MRRLRTTRKAAAPARASTAAPTAAYIPVCEPSAAFRAGSGAAADGEAAEPGAGVAVEPRSGRAGSRAPSSRATASETGSISVPALYMELKAREPPSVRVAGASVRVASPPSVLRPFASNSTSGTALLVSPAVVTSAVRTPLPSWTLALSAPTFRSRWAPVKWTDPAKAASRVPFPPSYEPLPRPKRNSAPPSSAPSARVHLPWPMEPVTYSRKVRRTPQSTAASAKAPAGGAPCGEPLVLGCALGAPAGCEDCPACGAVLTSAEREIGSSCAPAA
ncbi:hypothetical protein GCM10020254_58400 [Streptomyces goshikiensis]